MEATLRLRNAGFLQQINCGVDSVHLGNQRLINLHRLNYLIANCKERVQRRHWLLKDHRYLATTNLSNILNWQRQKIHLALPVPVCPENAATNLSALRL